MRQYLLVAYVVVLTGLVGCGGDGETACVTNDDCIEEHLCGQGGKCTLKDPVRIVTDELPDARLEVGYEFTLEAIDGIPPYTWSIIESPEWMSVDGQTGVLSGTPDQEAAGLLVKVQVEDSTAGRDSSAQAELFIDVNLCVNQASNPTPADGATSIPVDADLSWTAGSGATSHDVYFDTNNPPAFQGNQSGTTFDPGTLEPGVSYYWRIDQANADCTATGTVWSFTTADDTQPLVISNLNPANYRIVYKALDVGQLLYIDRSYEYDSVPSAYQGKTFIQTANDDKNSSGSSYLSFIINQDCTVYVAHDDRITTQPGWLGSFTVTGDNLSDDSPDNMSLSLYEKAFPAGMVTLGGNDGSGYSCGMYTVVIVPEAIPPVPPGQANNPNPADGAGHVSVDADLSWSAGSGTESHDVYFGETSPGAFQGNQAGTTFDPGTINNDTTYYWRIDEVNAYGTTEGAVWSFSTSSASVLPRVIVSTDIGGSDNDDYQSMVHYLVYADMFDTEGLISSPPHAGRMANILEVIDQYETDYSNLDSHSDFPTPQSLRDVTKQGATGVSPSAGYSGATEGSNWIISRANVADSRPLWILVWGSITDVAQAVHDDPGIKSKIRVYSIGSWNTDQDPNARDYLYNNHSDMWWIENDTTFRGMYIGGNQGGDLGNWTFVEQHVRHHGALGDFFFAKKPDIKMGDTPSVLYLLNGDPDAPTTEHWGGMFRLESVHTPPVWTDRLEAEYSEGGYDGAKTVNVHREAYLRDWQTRMGWANVP